MGKQLLFELSPRAAGNDGYLHDADKGIEQVRHLGIDGRLAFGERAIQVKDNKSFHAAMQLPAAKSPIRS